MSLHVKPKSLINLSLQRTVKLLADRVVELVKQAKVHNSKLLPKFRQSQQEILYIDIPTSVANALAYEYLQELDLRKDLLEFTDILEEVIQFMLPPQVSELCIDWHWFYIGEVLLKGGPLLQDIKVLKLSRRTRANVSNTGYTPDLNPLFFKGITDLRELILHDVCTDEILSVVCKTCRNMYSLDITGSRRVTDTAIDSILGLESLEKCLIKYTSITSEGIVLLLKGLLQKNCQLSAFSCKSISQEMLQILSQFPNLKNLSTSSDFEEGTNVTDNSLASLQCLEIDQRKRMSFPYPELLINHFGRHLLSLELETKDTDVSHLVTSCCMLISLHLRTNNIINSANVSDFPSLRNLTLVMAQRKSPNPLLSLCNNLKFLELCADLNDYTNKELLVSQTNALKKLEVLFIASNDESVPMSVVTNFRSHCNKLQTIKVFGGNYLELTDVFDSSHIVEVCPSLCSKFADEIIRTRRMFNSGKCGTPLVMRIIDYDPYALER